jgi:hypothetical protein
MAFVISENPFSFPFSQKPMTFILGSIRICPLSVAMLFSGFESTGIAAPISISDMTLTFHFILSKKTAILEFLLANQHPVSFEHMIDKSSLIDLSSIC